ncbi:MAG: hypothetical protein JKY96_00145 [Phycisphaerales bacterium]|nr:hypothetical protein [Phycisphaerales bacterium]
MSEILNCSINVGTNIIDWWFANSGQGPMCAKTIVLITLHSSILANTDAIAMLLVNRSAEAAKPLLRSILETHLYLEWVLQDKSQDTANAYLVLSRKKDLDLINSLDPQSSKYKSITGQINSTDDFYLPDSVNLNLLLTQRKELEEQLQLPTAVEILENLKTHPSNKKNLPWYAINGGPASIIDLATKLNRRGTYEKIYRALSSNAHGSDTDSFVLKRDNNLILKPIRRVENSPFVFNYACTIVCRMNRLLSEATQDRSLIVWVQDKYFSAIRKPKNRLSQLQIKY